MGYHSFVAIHPRAVVLYTMKCEATTKIFSVRKLNTSIYVHYVIFCFGLCVHRFFFIRISKQIGLFLRD